MGIMKTFNLSEEAKIILDKYKSKFPEFNLSAFISKSIESLDFNFDKKDLDKLNSRIIDKEKQLEAIKNEVEGLKDQLDCEKKKKENEENNFFAKEREAEELEKKKLEIDLRMWKNVVLTSFDLDELTAEVIAQKYLELPKPRQPLLDYIQELGYSFKE